MKAESLRIGNYVTLLGDTVRVTSLMILEQHQSDIAKSEYLNPIPLSEDVLIRCGFECSYKSDIHSVYSLGDGTISYYFWYGTGNSYLSIVGTKFICKTVHHLQNIVHDLLGHELELKTK